MQEVEAVRDENILKSIPVLLSKHSTQQMADVWEFGINMALRISDLLGIRYSDIKDGRLTMVESKTGKVADIPLNAKALAITKSIMKEYPEGEFLFQSRNSRNISTRIKPLSRQSVAKAFKDVGEIIGVKLGTHSMRKTRGRFLYAKTNDIARVSKMLRHSSTGVTLKYIGITKSDIDADFNEMVL
ncbi:tyrosine-type recombinase/integrase [Thalassotalea profundi]|uniref:Site-specific integrase n=1 Tax=Thalassotalea profundi TaxID=2036687 RepID=A0ABQ3IK68_9GAMM|nr:tyrosine-type recombinase/integrase [Thalassotalea profundi]GHE86272.1 site-specific integrase [Thalassotalea profundi]